MIELGISIAAIVAILFAGAKGSEEGLFPAFTRFLLGIIALLVAMRAWYPGTEWLATSFSVSEQQVTFAVFWGVFAVVLLPLLSGIKSLNEDFLPVYPAVLERLGGFLFGAANGAVLVSALLLSFTPNLPALLPRYDESKLLLPIHRFPALFYRGAEKALAHVPVDSPARTPLPVSTRTAPEAPLETFWQ